MSANMPLVEVTYLDENGDEQHLKELQTDARDQFAFSMIRRATKDIPAQKDDPGLWMGIIIFTAMRRAGHLADGLTWDNFLGNQLIDYKVLNTPAQQGAAAPLVTP